MFHSISSLTYRLVRGPCDLSRLRRLDSRSLQWRGWQISFDILAASHSISLNRGESHLTEIVACAPEFEGMSVLTLDSTAFAGCGDARICSEGLHVQACLKQITIEQANLLVREWPAESRLDCRYPGCDVAPFTAITWLVDAAEFQVQTLHTYPEEDGALYSRTLFRPIEEAQ